MKSFSLRIGDSICSLNKTQTRILIFITSVKRYENVLEHKTAFPDELFPSIFLVKAIQVRKFMSKFVHRSVAYRGLAARHSMRREKTGDKCCCFVQVAKQIFVASMQVYKDIWKPSIGDKLACEREFDNCFDKFAIKVVNNGETMGHLPREFSKIAW